MCVFRRVEGDMSVSFPRLSHWLLGSKKKALGLFFLEIGKGCAVHDYEVKYFCLIVYEGSCLKKKNSKRKY